MTNVQDHIVYVGVNGTFRVTGGLSSTPKDVDHIFEKIEGSKNKNHIVLYFHGGLVNEASGLETAKKIIPHIIEAGGYPIVFIWKTGLIEIIKENLSQVKSQKIFQRILKFVIKKVFNRLGFDKPNKAAEIRGQQESLNEDIIDIELSNEIPFKDYELTMKESYARGGDSINRLEVYERLGQLESRITDEIKNEIDNDYQFKQDLLAAEQEINEKATKGQGRNAVGISLVYAIGKIIYKVVSRFLSDRDHGLYPTVIEEMLRHIWIADAGAAIWQAMKDKSSNMWNPNDERDGQNLFTGRYVFDMLTKYKLANPATNVSLIGHSAGSIAICNLFKQTSVAPTPMEFETITFMAPACRIELFQQTMLSSTNRFKNLRIFTMADKNESLDLLVPYLYTRSLLYFISGVLEDNGASFDAPLLGLERHVGFKSPYNTTEYETTHRFVYESNKFRLCLSETADDSQFGLRTKSLKHGDFDDDSSTLESIKHIIQQVVIKNE